MDGYELKTNANTETEMQLRFGFDKTEAELKSQFFREHNHNTKY